MNRQPSGTAARIQEEPMDEEIVDSPDAWVAGHIQRFLATGGLPRPGTRDLLLTTRGRRTGRLRRTALAYLPDGHRYVLTASNAGADAHPSWYLNLVDDPRVTVQVGTRTLAAHARTATGEDRTRLWRLTVAAMPSYLRYQEMTARVIPVVIVEPTSSPGERTPPA
ncbi:nitroreductase/quinone reductase family protein [Sphaerisporangium sp. TRM90804]|uniref:nitroreductase/quinone reductase family protein n=1 Tax=Sphaerisporangium sp. TRM90804 TaxID=3031113 RepID=UPI002449CA46|nr:nitroreductase/quinone reductase family protein [Sphaerisporangium sp. TRM90804]MDH2426141.1 nitroreductase/quinone reductase family protein [Sphaerisporangium sp. TRM90804]